MVGVCNKKMGKPYDKCNNAFNKVYRKCRKKMKLVKFVCKAVRVLQKLCHVVRVGELLCKMTAYVKNQAVKKIKDSECCSLRVSPFSHRRPNLSRFTFESACHASERVN